MSFLAPLAFAVLGLAAPLVLLYFLKVRRRERTVSSLMLWGTELRDREASAFFQRLQRDPLLLLQLLALVALALALARPVVTVTGEGARKVVVVLDTSGGMRVGEEVLLEFKMPEAAQPSKVCAKVTSNEPPDSIGVEFLDLSASDGESIQRYIAGSAPR